MDMVLVVLLFITPILASNNVPVLLWTNRDSVAFEKIPAGQVFNKIQLTNYIQPIFSDKKNAVLFVQNELSIEDFTHYGGVYDEAETSSFENVKYFLAKYESTHLPAVSDPVSGLKYIREHYKGDILELEEPYILPDIKTDKPKLLVVYLPDVNRENVRKSLKYNDDIVKKVMEKLENSGTDFTALFTGREPSPPPETKAFSGRHLLAVEESNNETDNFRNISGCMFVYGSTFNLSLLQYEVVDKKEQWVIPKTGHVKINMSELIDEGSMCENDTSYLQLFAVGDTDSISNITIMMRFNLTKYSWKTVDMTIKFKRGENASMMELNAVDINAPKGFSYHCANTVFETKIVNRTEGFVKATLVFSHFQVQPFKIKNGKFGRPNDCVGFFTIPILTGLFVSIIFTIILVFGFSMLASIVTQDKFDDPKGKTISVPIGD